MKRPNRKLPRKTLRPQFGERTYVMGVLNVTPDSFSDAGRFFDRDTAIERGLEMITEGADIIDVGGESTRPGARDITVAEEIDRVIPVIEGISKKTSTLISVDTRKSKVAQAAISAGAGMVNDVSGLRHDGNVASVAAKNGAYLIVMHMQGTPETMQVDPGYRNLIKDITASLKESADTAKKAGVKQDKIIIDPGIGFGKTVEHNLEILNRLDEFRKLGYPVCVGTSRKSFIGKVLDMPDSENRLSGTIATCVIAVMKGADILRVHDVKDLARAIRMTDSVLRMSPAAREAVRRD